jgi:hypothetical protein
MDEEEEKEKKSSSLPSSKVADAMIDLFLDVILITGTKH